MSAPAPGIIRALVIRTEFKRHRHMTDQNRHNLFSELIARYQSELYGYIFAVVRNWEDADDLFQSICVVLWRKFESFRPGSEPFALCGSRL
jgi:DNA-directed RNA polymerase specialized sigma24 family protein